MASSSSIAKDAATGILQSSLSPKYLHTNSTSHTWPFSAIAELIDNAYDPDVKASQLWIDRIRIHGLTCLTFTDNGRGMQPDKLHKMLSFGFCEKVADGTHMPVGHYGNGFKSGSMRLGKDALVLTKQGESRSIGYLSQTYLETIKAETVVVPIANWDKNNDESYDIHPGSIEALKDVIEYSLLRSEGEIESEFDEIPSDHGTRIIISNIRKTMDNKSEFDFESDEFDILIPNDTSESEKYRKTKRQNHVPECDYSLRAYCAILYLKPKMQIFLRQKKVKTLVVEKSLSKTEVDRYKPTFAEAVKVVFGFNSMNKNHYGIMMYHRNRLIKPYERVGYQLRANNLGVGVVGVVQCDFLQPTHNKQDFDYTKAYRACIHALGVKLNEYWNEKKGPVKLQSSSTESQLIPEPTEIQQQPDQIWVQCDEPSCLKWRKLPDGIDPSSLPEKWFCVMNPDPKYKSCDVPEEKEEEKPNITPYAKVQKKRLVKEMEEKKRRDKAAKLAAEEKMKELENDLKKREELLNKRLELTQQNENLAKQKIKVESGSLPTAQVAPRPTTKPLSAIPPTAKPSPRQIGSQLAARLAPASQSPTSTIQTSQPARNPAKPTPSPARLLARSPLSAPLSTQSTPRSAPINQSAHTKLVLTNHSPSSSTTTTSQSNKISTPPNTKLKLVQPKPTVSDNVRQAVSKLVTEPQAQKIGARNITFKMVKAANGNTYLIQERKPQGTATTTGTKPVTLKTSGPGLATMATLGKSTSGTATSQVKVASVPKQTMSQVPLNSKVDVKPQLNVLPKPQTPSARTNLVQAATTANNRVLKVAVQNAVTNQQAAQNSTKTVSKSHVATDCSRTLAATAYSEITGNTSTTPQDVKNILGSTTSIKREAPENAVSPIPAKVQRKKSDAAVIVIDPLPAPSAPKQVETTSEKQYVKILEKRVNELMKEIEEVKSEGADKMGKLAAQLQEKQTMLSKRNKDLEENKKVIHSKECELKEHQRQLKVLRGNVCKLLQVLVPEIDVETEGDGDNIDDLLKQVLEANK